MYKHFYTLKRPCPKTVAAIDLTDDVKEYILANRILIQEPAKSSKISRPVQVRAFSVDSTSSVTIPIVRNEEFYQRILESVLGAGHKRLPCGETDITTDEFHAEIKVGKCWKDGIGQLVCYNKEDPRLELRLYLFGPQSSSKKTIANIQKHGIKVFVIEDLHSGIAIDDMQAATRQVVDVKLTL